MNRRPTGVVLAAIVLGLATCLLLLGAVSTVFMGVMTHYAPAMAAGNPDAPAPPPGLIAAIMAVVGVVYLALAGWGGATVVGLFRMRSWSRISIMIIGGCLAVLGILASLGMVAMQFVSQSASQSAAIPAGTNPAALRIVFIVAALFWLAIALVGVWWLVYFAQRRTRDSFTLAAAGRANYIPPPPPFSPAQLDFSVAQPMPPQLYAYPTTFPAPPVVPAPAARVRPVSMVVVGVFLLLGAVFALVEAFLHIPLFLLGVTLTGWTAHITMLIWAVVSAYAGYGLIKLQKPAWLVTMAIFAVGAVNSLLIVFPAYRAKMEAYTRMLTEQTSSWTPKFPTAAGTPQPVFDPHMQTIFTMLGLVFALVFTTFLFILLWRARWAFEPDAFPSTNAGQYQTPPLPPPL